MVDAVQGRDTSVRGTISKGGFVQGAQHPRIFGLGHIGRGHINPASAQEGYQSIHLDFIHNRRCFLDTLKVLVF